MSTKTGPHLTVSKYLAITAQPEFITNEWRDRARCLEATSSLHGEPQADPMDWFPEERNYVPPRVEAICFDCPVRLTCLVTAVFLGQEHGIWGGRPPRQVRAITRKIKEALRGVK